MIRSRDYHRSGKVLLFVVIALPTVLAVVGLIYDSGLMAVSKQRLQHAADAASTAAAMELALGKTESQARFAAEEYLLVRNAFSEGNLTVHIPPVSGGYAGRSGFVEVAASTSYSMMIMQALGGAPSVEIPVRATAGRLAATSGGAVVVLDDDPPGFQIQQIPLVLPLSFPAILGGLEVLGLGAVRVDGAVHINTAWGGVDEDDNPAGESSGPPYGATCTPILSLSRVNARDIRVVGGVDNPDNYGHFTAGQSSPLRANRLPVPDPLESLPVPTTANSGVDATLRGGVRVVQLPLIFAPTVLRPGVYDWIEILSGNVIFEPGVYILRGVNPITRAALVIAGGIVRADGVMFYVTNSAGYDAAAGSPDSADGETAPVAPQTVNLTPSVIVSAAFPGSRFSPLDSPGNPFDGMLIYQRRQDFRPIVIVYQGLLGSPTFDGMIYAKWGHVTFVGDGTHDMPIVAGSVRFVPVLGITIAPTRLLQPAYDVYLVE